MIIALEGMDCVGKTTQAQLLVERLKSMGYRSALLSFPRKGTDIGDAIYKRLFQLPCAGDERAALKYTLELLFEADRYDAEPQIRQMLKDCDFLVFDRFSLSGAVYAEAIGVDAGWRRALSRFRSIEPDVTVVLDMPVKEGTKRRPTGRDRYEMNLMLQEHIRWLYLKAAEENGYPVVDACGKIIEVHERIWQAIADRIAPVLHNAA